MGFGALFYRGPSLLTGEPIVGILSGLEGDSTNRKTGPMVQAYVVRSDMPPMAAIRSGADEAICGDCKLRGDGAFNRKCYVSGWLGPNAVYKQFIAGNYHEATWPELHALLEGRHVRLGAYGDPAAIPFEVWRSLLTTAAGHVAYSRAWHYCDQRVKLIAMASVDTVDEFYQARALGWRTFRIRRTSNDSLLIGNIPLPEPGKSRSVSLEFVCPASDEAGHRSTCQACQLCRGTSSPARSVVIVAHGKPSSLKAFGIQPEPIFVRRSRVCPRCGEDFIQEQAKQKLCPACLTPRQLCEGGCGRRIVGARCPDCTLARQQSRGRELLEQHRQRQDEVLA